MSENSEGRMFFDAYYYAHGCGAVYERNDTWLKSFRNIADRIIRTIQPKTVLDAGCAMGFLVEGLRSYDVDAWGIDISEYAIDKVHPDIRPYCRVGSIIEPFLQRFDLIVSIEVLEHMQPRDSEKTVANLCQYTDDILISTTPFDYKEATHFNVQPPEYWAALFAEQGFFRDVDYDASFITPWAVRFRRMSENVIERVRDYERRFWQLSKENVDLRSLTLEMRNEITNLRTREQEMESRDISNSDIQKLQLMITEKDIELNSLSEQLNVFDSSRTHRLLERILKIRRKMMSK